jgi:hypothetical protein
MAISQSIADCPPFPEIQGVEFRHVPDRPGYAASSDGRIWSALKRGNQKKPGCWHEMRGTRTHNGGRAITFAGCAGVSRARLILEIFRGAPEKDQYAQHINEDAEDDRIENLLWVERGKELGTRPPFPPIPIVSSVVFRKHPDYPGYLIGDDGSVWTCWKASGLRGWRVGKSWRKRVAAPNNGGYLSLVMRTGRSLKRTKTVHQLVLEAFVGPKPEGQEACHENGNRMDNRLCNLRWDTKSSNQLDSIRHGTHNAIRRGSDSPKAKLSDEDVRMIRKCAQYIGCRIIGRMFEISQTHVKDIVHRRARMEVA